MDTLAGSPEEQSLAGYYLAPWARNRLWASRRRNLSARRLRNQVAAIAAATAGRADRD